MPSPVPSAPVYILVSQALQGRCGEDCETLRRIFSPRGRGSRLSILARTAGIGWRASQVAFKNGCSRTEGISTARGGRSPGCVGDTVTYEAARDRAGGLVACTQISSHDGNSLKQMTLHLTRLSNKSDELDSAQPHTAGGRYLSSPSGFH